MVKNPKQIKRKAEINRKKYQGASFLLILLSALGFLSIPIIEIFRPNLSQTVVLPILSASIGVAVSTVILQIFITGEDIKASIIAPEKDIEIRAVGTSEAALAEIARKIHRAVDVSNTFVGLSDTDSTDGDALLLGAYKSWLENGLNGDWIDIISPAQLFSKRYRKISVNRNRISGAHTLKILRHTTPLINFIILHFGAKDEEVYFGWISGARSSTIFASSDAKTVGIFKRYFYTLEKHRLWGDPVPVNYLAQHPSKRISRGDLADKIGSWATLSMRDGKVATYGFFSIYIADETMPNLTRGQLYFNGYVLGKDLRYLSPIEHDQDKIAHYKNKMFIEYGNRDAGDRGFCFYDFRNSQMMGEAATHIDGFFIDERDDIRNAIKGFSVAKIEEIERDSFDSRYLTDLKLAERVLTELRNQRRITQEQSDHARQMLPKPKDLL